MKKQILFTALLMLFVSFLNLSCQKETNKNSNQTNQASMETGISNVQPDATSAYNLEVVLHGEGNRNGHIRFRQDEDPAHIVTLGTKVHNLAPYHEYLLQRAVDVIIDGNCTGTNWLTLGRGSVPQSIYTDNKGDGSEELWRDLSAVPAGSVFDIHFRVLDAVTMQVVLTSDCYQFTVR